MRLADCLVVGTWYLETKLGILGSATAAPLVLGVWSNVGCNHVSLFEVYIEQYILFGTGS